MIIRTLLCRPKEIDAGEYKAREFDKDLIARHLSEAVQIPTVSMVGEFEGVDQPFYDYHAWLEKTYPLVHKTAQKNRYKQLQPCLSFQRQRFVFASRRVFGTPRRRTRSQRGLGLRTVRRHDRRRIHLGTRNAGYERYDDFPSRSNGKIALGRVATSA